MILAAARVGERKKGASPPEALLLALQCRRWGALPFGGGVLDQPDWLLRQMSMCLNTFDAFRSYSDRPVKMNDVRFAELNPGAWTMIMQTEKLRLISKGLRKPDDFEVSEDE